MKAMPNPVIEHIHLSGVTYDVNDIGAERLDNKVSTFQDAPDDAHYPSEKLVHDKLVELSSDIGQLLDEKQERLVSGNNIKKVNGNSILGSGNIIVSGGTFTLSSPEILQYTPVTVKIAAD